MKYLFAKTLAGAVLLTIAGATTANAQSINGTAHDLESGTEGICTYCHTPHGAPDASVPLWARDTATATFTLYTSVSLDSATSQPEGTSLACLSCHDGATAYNSLAGTTTIGGGNIGTMTGTKAVGASAQGSLADDHPISMAYASADTAFNAAVSGKIDVLPLYRAAGVTTGAGTQVECATCHSVHDTTNAPFLRKTNTGSALCITCHTK